MATIPPPKTFSVETIPVFDETKEFIATATDREIQNEIYLTLRRIEILERRSADNLKTIATIILVLVILSALVGIVIGIASIQ